MLFRKIQCVMALIFSISSIYATEALVFSVDFVRHDDRTHWIELPNDFWKI